MGEEQAPTQQQQQGHEQQQQQQQQQQHQVETDRWEASKQAAKANDERDQDSDDVERRLGS